MNVLHISESDGIGGSGRSAFRLHSNLRRVGLGSRMLVGRRRTDDRDVRLLKRSIAWRALDRASGELLDLLNLQYVFYPSSFGVAVDPWFREADVVQLYNTHGSYFSHSALPVLSRRRPVVWRLSDMWALTGHVAYSYDCERWRHGCGTCPYLGEYPALSRDTTALLWRWKNEVYEPKRLRESVADLLAPARLAAPKRGFVLPLARWLRTELRPLAEQLLSDEHLRRQGFSSHGLPSAFSVPHLDGERDESERVWPLLTFQLWHLLYVDEALTGPPTFGWRDLQAVAR